MIRRRVLILGLAALLPLLAFALGSVAVTLRQQQERMRDDAVAFADRLLGHVEEELRVHVALLTVLARSPSLDASALDLALFHDVASRFAEATEGWDRVTLLSQARQLVNTHVPYGTPLPGVVDRETYERVLETGRPAISGLGRPGHFTPSRRLIAVRVPVPTREDDVRMVLTALVSSERLATILDDAPLPDLWRPLLVDGDGVIVANPASPERVGEPLGRLGLAARESGDGGVYDGMTAAGTPVVTAFRQSPTTGWSLHVSVPLDLYNAPLRRSLYWLGLGAALALALSTVFVLLLRREMAAGRRETLQRERALRMEALGRLTGGVAHDFNNLLMIVLSSADAMQRRLAVPEAARYIDAIRKAGERGAEITRQLLVFSRGDAQRAEPIDAVERVRALLGMFRQAVPRSVALDGVLPSERLLVRVDPIQFDLALLNIVTNARDAMPDGGTLSIAVGRSPKTGAGAGTVSIAITDTGAGISDDALPHVFEPFFTTKEAGRGTGLGLAQVHGFATASGGTADVESRPGRGTTVTIRLPEIAASSLAASRISDDRTAAPEPTGRGRILVVDDDEAVRAATAEYLAETGWEVRSASDGASALAIFETEDVDVVVSDIVMPGGLDGVALVRELRRRRPALPIVLVSGWAASVQEAADLGVEVLNKPYPMGALDEAIRRANRMLSTA